MKKFLTTVGVSFALVTAAFAGPLNPRGIPADAIGIAHGDLEAGAKSTLSKKLQEIYLGQLLKSERDAKEFNEFKAKTGIDPFKDIHDYTVGILPPKKEKKTDGEASINRPNEPSGAVVIVRGKFSAAKIRAYIAEKEKDTKTVTIDKHAFYKFGSGLALPLDNAVVIVFGDREKDYETVAKAALAAFFGKTKSYAPPAALTNLGKQTVAPASLVYFNAVPFNFPKPAQDDPMGVQVPDEIFLAFGDAAGTLKLRGVAGYPTESEAQQFLAKAQMGIGFAQLSLGQLSKGRDGKPDPKKAKLVAEAGKILSALKVTTGGKHFNASLDYSSTDLAKLIADSIKTFDEDDGADAGAGE
jgi:hypothetical protein